MLTSNEIRRQFIEFFVDKHGHTAVPSSSVVPLDDPTLMFTNAGMNQFKDVFLGTGSRPFSRAVDTQKCIRVSGKHNDLEEVGRDTYHHTFFEMLGNWSFGDYYKAEAIRWAWELLTEVWGVDKTRLHATVFGGDKKDGVEADSEARRLWTEVTDIDPSHIHDFGKKDNFWMMGDTGPCGPCSEIHIDLTPDKSGAKLVNADDPRVMEIWNLVFIQYNRDADGKLEPLPAQHVDTGMGFERIVAVLQGKSSNYDTDVFTPIMDAIGQATGKQYTAKLDDLQDIAFRVVADHLRMLAFSITDGALPSNKGRGSVLRSVLRRAVRFGWQVFEQREPFIYKLVPALVDHMGDAFPELKSNPDRLAKVIRGEEEDFLRTIARGLSLFDEEASQAAKSKEQQISGKAAFDLHSTYGFPIDLTEQMASEQGLTVNRGEYDTLEAEHVCISRTKKGGGQVALNVSGGLPETDDRPRWTERNCTGKLVGWIADNRYSDAGELPPDTDLGLVLDRTCFYAEAGGQIGDAGVISTETGKFTVTSTVKVGSAVVHVGSLTEGKMAIGDEADLQVSEEREFTRKNHTATHLLHWALQSVLGDHIEQRGSRVKPEEFTFDFSHDNQVSLEERARVERMVNEKIYQDLPVEAQEYSIDEARQLPGVRAFFGDKYGDTVRVVSIGDGFSREFCGGVHLEHTGQAGPFKILREELVAKGVRRLTCVTAREAVQRMQTLDAVVTELAGHFSCQAEELPARIAQLEEKLKKTEQQLKKGAATDLQGAADALLAAATEHGGVKVIVGQMPPAADEQLRQQVDRLRKKAGSAVVVIGWPADEKVQLLAAVTDDLIKQGLHAGKLVGQVAKVVGGGGGGKPNLASAGGKHPEKLDQALELAKKLAAEQLGA